jgi:hypothetical protein
MTNDVDGSAASDCSTAIDAARWRARRMAIRREQLDQSPILRQRAVSQFPLMVAQIADDMRRMLDCVGQVGESTESREYLQYAEDMIRDVYRDQFGRELGQ